MIIIRKEKEGAALAGTLARLEHHATIFLNIKRLDQLLIGYVVQLQNLVEFIGVDSLELASQGKLYRVLHVGNFTGFRLLSTVGTHFREHLFELPYLSVSVTPSRALFFWGNSLHLVHHL